MTHTSWRREEQHVCEIDFATECARQLELGRTTLYAASSTVRVAQRQRIKMGTSSIKKSPRNFLAGGAIMAFTDRVGVRVLGDGNSANRRRVA